MMIFLSLGLIQNSYSENLNLFTNSKVYSEGQPLLTYGNALPNEDLLIRLFSPDGTIANFDQIKVDKDGMFNHVLVVWPSPSANFPYGTYTVEVLSPEQNGISKRVDVKFTSTSELVDVPVDRQINTIVFVPETGVRNESIRVFVQTTSDGLLIEGEPTTLLATTHVHLPNGSVENLSNSFQTLHQGLYYVDYIPKLLGTYVFHVVTFHQGTVSHGSAATTILSQDIKGISEQIIELNSILDETSAELNVLKSEIEGFGSTLEKASGNIDASVSTVSNSVRNIEEASVQLNSLLFPIVASIGIIVALQIVIIARRR
ncbi:envelope protein [Nitrosopumilus sp. b1]|uniref:methyl-accepting chemotaxis protein n=1 Tax=Nitrosopumilus sp. b1 TaxID=2109907 RepID=UPI0015F3BD94|nr:methyl-accepting chemotaxis protein [Nitrosopumilus sp. b1]KAF6242382.1 envelope protein [Nitrosopumilus sp. b1]